MVRGLLWPAGIVAFTLAMFPLSFTAPVVGIAAGVVLGWWAGRTRLGLPVAVVAAVAGWLVLSIGHILQHLDPQPHVGRSGELAGGAVFAAGAILLVWAVATMAKRGNRIGAAAVAVIGGLSVLQASCYVLVKIATPSVLVSPWLWYVGSMFPYGRWSGQTLMPPDRGYLESNDWFQLADSLVMYPGVWTFLLAFLLTCACAHRGEDIVAVQADAPVELVAGSARAR